MAAKLGLSAALRASTALITAHRFLRASPILGSASLLALGVGGAPALAQTVWSGPGTDFNTGTNWSTGNVPTSWQTADFQGAGPTSLSTSLNTQLAGIIFSGVPSYNLTLGDDMTLFGSVVNTSASQHTINVAEGKTLFFQGTAESGADVNYGGAGSLVFDDNAAGGNSAFTVGSQIGIRGNARTITLGSLSGNSGTLIRNFGTGPVTVQVGSLGTSTTFSGHLGSDSGAGALTLDKFGTGTLTLAGANMLAGTTITEGTLAIANGGTLGDGAVTNNAALAFNRTDTSTFANTISGSGTVTQAGSGTTILTGDNAYTGTTTISAGTLRIGSGGTTGTLGTGDVLNNASLVFNRDSLTVTNAIAGTGSVTIAGSTALSGTNSYQGGTVINSFLSVAANSALGATSGGLTFNNGFLGATASFTSNRAITINAGGAFFEPSIGTTLTLTGLISGAGGLGVNGPGTLVLSSGNTYLGATVLNGGTTVIAADSAFGNTAGRLHLNGGTLQTTANLTTARNIELQSSGGTFTPDAGTVLTLSGAVIGSNLTKAGTGTLVLTGANTYSGTTTISAGTLRVGNGDLTGSLGTSAVVNNGALVFDRAGTLTVTGAISGAGALRQTGAGTTILTGANTYSGTTTIDANGTLQIGSAGTTGTLGSGNVVVGNNLLFYRSDAALTVANAISGDGKVRQIGSGTTTLTGALSHTGGTFVDTGTLVLGNALNAVTLPSNATITSGGSLTLANGSLDNATIMNSGHLDIQGTATAGNASIINAGSVRFLASATGGAAAYTGQAGSIMDFSLMAMSGATLGSLAGTGTVSLGSIALAVGGDDTSTTFAGVIAGGSSSELEKVGTGTLTLTGTNTYSGDTTVSAGTLKIGDGGTTGTLGSGAIINNSVLVFDRSNAFTMANTITGMGALTKNGAGNLTLSGDSSAFTGTTQVAAGTLSVNGKLGGDLSVVIGGILGGSGTIGGNVTVGGTLSAGNSPGTLTINGDLTLTAGSTSLFELNSPGVVGGAGVGGNDLVKVGGALALGGTLDAKVAAAGYYRLFDYGTLAPGSAFATETISSTNAGFTVASHAVRTDIAQQVNLSVLGAGQIMQFWDGNNSASNGVVDGGSGTWQSFATNWTDVDGMLNGGWAGSVGIFEGTAGTVAVSGAQGFDTLQFNTDGYVVQGGALAFGVAGGATLNINNSVSTTIGSTLQDGVGSTLTKVGNGTLVLSGSNTYTGGTMLLGGALSVSNDANLGAASGALAFNGGTLQVTGTAFNATARSIIWGVKGGGFDIADAGNTFTVSQHLTGSGPLSKTGEGTLNLSSANTYAGGTMVSQGVLQAMVTGGLGTGPITITAGPSRAYLQFVGSANAGTLAIGLSNATSYLNFYDSASADRATVTNAGRMNFYHSASAGTATINVNGGGTSFNNGSTAGNAQITTTNNGRVDFYDDATAGSAAITNNATGGTRFHGQSTADDATILNNTGGQVDVSGLASGIGIGSLTGDGTVLLGARTLTLGGLGTNDTIGGVIQDGGAGGSLIKTGAGTLTLNGINTYTGTTTVEGGKLVVGGVGYSNASLAGAVTVATGGTLGGIGTVGGGLMVAAGGTITPGNSIGTLSVSGDLLLHPGSLYDVEIAANGLSDRIDVSGTAMVTDAQVSVAMLDPETSYQDGQTYRILDATGGVTGKFADVVSRSAFLDLDLDHAANSVDLRISLKNIEPERPLFSSVAQTSNQFATADALDGLQQSGPQLALYNALLMLDAGQARGAFDQLSGEIHASAKTALIEDSRFVREAASARVRAAFEGVGATSLPVLAYGPDGQEQAPAATESAAAWGSVFGAWGSIDGDGNAAGLDRSTGGFFTGLDGLVTENVRLGIMTGYSHSSFDADDRASAGSSDNYHLGLYGGTQVGALGLRSGLAYSWHDIDTSRSVTFPGFADNLTANYDAGIFQAFGEAGYRIDTVNASFEPFANLAYVNLHTSGFAETGGAAALTSAGQSTEATFTTLGIRASTDFAVGTINTTARGMLGWKHAFGDIAPLATQAFARSDAFTIAGAPIARNAAIIEAGLDFDISDSATLGISYTGQFGSDARDNGAKADLSVRF